jgi:enoyl-CoA hydratase/carnithine racemase
MYACKVQVGLVNEVVDDDDAALGDAARALAQEMLRCGVKGLQLTKEQLNAVADGGSLTTAMVCAWEGGRGGGTCVLEWKRGWK